MRAAIGAAIIAASVVVGTGTGGAACRAARSHPCVINLGTLPQISQDIVAAEPVAKPTPAAPPAAAQAQAPYTGPTIGLNHRVRRAPEIGYRWAIN